MRPEIIKLLEENISSKVLDVSLSNNFFFFWSASKSNGNKKQKELHQTNFCATKGKINKWKGSYWKGEDICKLYIQ